MGVHRGTSEARPSAVRLSQRGRGRHLDRTPGGRLPRRAADDGVRDAGYVERRAPAPEAGRGRGAVPALCPRLRFRITDASVTDPLRQAGTASLDQLHEDFTQLEALGVRHVTLDWYTDDLDLTRRHEWGWRMFATMAEKVFDLVRETVRS